MIACEAQPVTCGCGHILAKPRDDGLIEVRHRGMVIIAKAATIKCPRCGAVRLDISQ